MSILRGEINMTENGLTMAGLGSMVLGVVLIIVLYGIIPLIGEELDNTVEIPENNSWGTNSSVATVPTGSEFWTTVSGFVTLSALMLFVGGFIGVLKGIKG